MEDNGDLMNKQNLAKKLIRTGVRAQTHEFSFKQRKIYIKIARNINSTLEF